MTTPRKFMVVADLHGYEMDPEAVAACLAFKEDFNPDIRVIAGDLWDFGAIRKGASDEERAVSMRDDFDQGAAFADRFFGDRAFVRNTEPENHLMLGNHDVRAYDLAGSVDAVKADLGARMVKDIEWVAKRNNATLWPYDSRKGVLSLGKLNVVHGYHTGASACASHSRIYGNVIFGHVHSIESYQTPGLTQQEARAIGCLCKLDVGYADRKTGKLRWSNGFAYGYIFEDGTYQINQARFVDGKFWCATELKGY